jgi:cyclohexadieny/prephenate dehydrogenase
MRYMQCMKQNETIAILGLGLLGSSVARACRQSQSGCRIVAYDTNPLALQFGKQQGFVDEVAESVRAAVRGANVVVIASPPSAAVEMIPTIASAAPKNALITDVVSVKSPVAAAMRTHFADKFRYVPAHPIAGSEQVGVAAGRADLFAGKRVILTPETPEDAGIADVAAFWERFGATVEYMPADIHDMVYAHVSHLPQLLAFALKPKMEEITRANAVELPDYFVQFTRLCSSDRRLWDDIFLNNKPELDTALARFLVMFAHIRSELAEGASEQKQSADITHIRLWAELLPRIISSCLIGTIAQESKQVGFNFMRFAGNGLKDFTAPLKDAPDKHLEDISNLANPIVAAMDELLTSLAEWVVIKTS